MDTLHRLVRAAFVVSSLVTFVTLVGGIASGSDASLGWAIMFSLSFTSMVVAGFGCLATRTICRFRARRAETAEIGDRPEAPSVGVFDLLAAVAFLALLLGLLMPTFHKATEQMHSASMKRLMMAASRDVVLESLCGDDESGVVQAFRELGKRGFVDEDRPALLRAFADKRRPWPFRYMAASALADCPAPHPDYVLEGLAAILEEDDPDIPDLAAWTIHNMVEDSPQPNAEYGRMDVQLFRRWWAERDQGR